MKNKYLAGFLSGMAVALVVITIVLSAYTMKTRSYDGTTDDGVVAAEVQNTLSKKKVELKIDKLESLIQKYYLEDVDVAKLEDGIYKGMLQSLGDPYSVYYNKKEFSDLMESSSGVYCGIGTTVTQNMSTGIITLVKPFPEGPAYKAGLLPGDVLYKVEGEEVTGKDLSDVVTKMKGEEGTEVSLSIVREGEEKPLEVTIKRKKIEVPTIEYEMLEGNIGYIQITEFDEVTDEQYRDALKNLEKQGMKGLIVDVRNNPGGLLDVVVDMLDRMLPEGLVVYTEDKNGNRDERKSTDKEQFTKPLVVLTNGHSASAAEIFAGAIQDYGIGKIVGTTTYGKGIVQSVIPLYDKTAIKVTVSKYYTPKGRNIHGTGIKPDVEVDLTESLKKQVIIKKSEDNQLQQGIKEINAMMK